MYHCCDTSPEIPENAEISGFAAITFCQQTANIFSRYETGWLTGVCMVSLL